jgi:hypothetical protein
MRFVIALLLITIYIAFVLATAKEGIEGVDALIGYVFGMLLAPAIIAGLFCIPKSGRNNKRFFRAFNVMLLLAIIGRLGDLAEVIETANKPPQQLTGANNQITITVPGSWVSNPPPNENVLLNLSNDSGYVNIIVAYEFTGTERPQLTDYAQRTGNKFKDIVPDFQSISPIETCTSTKMACVYQVVTTTNDIKGTKTILASLRGKDGYYNFVAVTNPGLLDRYRDDIFKALMSLDEVQ